MYEYIYKYKYISIYIFGFLVSGTIRHFSAIRYPAWYLDSLRYPAVIFSFFSLSKLVKTATNYIILHWINHLYACKHYMSWCNITCNWLSVCPLIIQYPWRHMRLPATVVIYLCVIAMVGGCEWNNPSNISSVRVI